MNLKNLFLVALFACLLIIVGTISKNHTARKARQSPVAEMPVSSASTPSPSAAPALYSSSHAAYCASFEKWAKSHQTLMAGDKFERGTTIRVVTKEEFDFLLESRASTYGVLLKDTPIYDGNGKIVSYVGDGSTVDIRLRGGH